MRRVAVALLLLAAAAPADLRSLAPPRLLPVDEAASQPDFFSFRAQLAAAVARRDAAAVLAVVHPDIKNGFGGDDGIAEFRKMWRLQSPESPFWEEFGTVLALGGRFDGPGLFTAPYMFTDWPGELDAFEHLAVVGSEVGARQAPREDAPIVERLTFAIVRVGPEGYVRDSARWQGIVLPDGRRAYLPSSSVRSPIDYRARFEREQGRWRLRMFLAGD